MAKKSKAKKTARVEEGRVRVHDPFELIRWLALSQPDPKKALAELVQNSLDAGARRIQITRVREKKLPCLKVLDDGEGVIPEIADRREALRYVATHIGHSRKRSLSPQERLSLMTQGQYGIGLLGFWCLGEMLEIRSSLPGQKPYRLVLRRDDPKFKIEPLRGKLSFDERFTEVVVVGLNREATAAMGARRAGDYLASELRGQLLHRSVDVVLEDKMSRGRAPKTLRVRPPRFLGERLEGIDSIDVPGHATIRLEVYITGDDNESEGSPALALYAAGTLVAEDFSELSALNLDHEPWTDARLTGLVDFPELRVAPGSRRGVVPDDLAHAFAEALRRMEPLLTSVLETKKRERASELDRGAIRDLQRAFRDFYRKRPRYTMLPTEQKTARGGGDPAVGEDLSPRALEDDETPLTESGEAPSELFPPGPLEAVALSPAKLVLEPDTERAVRARATDAAGRSIPEGVVYRWTLSASVGSLREEGVRAVIAAGEHPAEGSLGVTAAEAKSGREVSVAQPVSVVSDLPTTGSEGIPEPELVDAPGASWRSRFVDERWQVNTGHPDFHASASRPALKLRYLAALFAKEVVLRSSQDPRLAEPLEQMVEVSTYADRELTERSPRGRRRRKS